VGPSKPVSKQPVEREIIQAIDPRAFYDSHPDVVRHLRHALEKGLEYWHASGQDTSNGPCLEGLVLFLTNVDDVNVAVYEHVKPKAPADPIPWWATNQTVVYRAMAIVALESYIEDGGWAGPQP
jgi:hypothetical protein